MSKSIVPAHYDGEGGVDGAYKILLDLTCVAQVDLSWLIWPNSQVYSASSLIFKDMQRFLYSETALTWVQMKQPLKVNF